jgi:putative DNA methylase
VRSWRETCELNKGHPQAAELFNPDKLPAFHDPFAGGGALPLEAQRLGLESYASDLNPVAVTINKAMIEIPPRFAGRAPVGRCCRAKGRASLHEDWSRAAGWPRTCAATARGCAPRRKAHWAPVSEDRSHAEMVAERPDLKPLLGRSSR